ncbi:MAG TPA: response regulator [Pirellulales bacterium]|nr:response regulator [Pirellulales bacterium]
MTCTISPMRVLVVDDNDDAALSLAVLLKHLGHEAAVAEGGEAALQLAPIFRPDALFIDLAMPKINGLEVARQLRQTSRFSRTPFIAVSGYVDACHRREATDAGFTEFMAKPYPLAELQLILTRVRARIDAAIDQTATLGAAAEQSRRLVQQSRQALDDFWRTRPVHTGQVLVSVEKSGISNILTVSQRQGADELRRWLKAQRCRVGPVFEPAAGRFAFFVYSKRHLIGDLIAQHGGFTVEMVHA